MRRWLALILLGGVLLMSRVALWDEWVDEDPLGEVLSGPWGASVVDGTPFLTDVLTDARLVVLIKFGTTWTDVTTDVLYVPQPLSVTLGRGSESGVAPPATARLTLLNPDRRYSQFDPLSPNWPYVRENAILWVRVFVGGQYFTRFYGEIKGFKQGHDLTGRYSIASVTAAGITQRLGLRTAPLRSALYRAITKATVQPVAYWTLEDGTSATQAASGLAGGTALTPTGTVKFGQTDGASGSDKQPDFSGGSYLSGTIAPRAGVTAWTVECVFKSPAAAGTGDTPILRWVTSGGYDGALWYTASLGISSSRIHILNGDPRGNHQGFFLLNSAALSIYDGAWHHFRMTASSSGGTTVYNVYLDNTLVATDSGSGDPLGDVQTFVVSPSTPDGFAPNYIPSVGHVDIYDQALTSSISYTPSLGHVGESPYGRLVRICAEEGIPFETVDYYVSSVTMGPQGIDTLMNIVRECELADAGFIYDGLSEGLRLQGISQRYDQFSRLTINGTTGELAPLFEPLPDDYGRVNRMTVQRKNGSSSTAVNEDGPLGTDAVGVYDASLPQPVNYQNESLLYFRAAWEVHKGSGRPGFRYPSVSLKLRNTPNLIYSNSVTGWLAITPGLMLTVTQPFTAQNSSEDIRLVVEGWTETLTPKNWEVTANCSRQDVYDVFKIEDSTLGRLCSGGASLSADAAAGSSTLSVATAAGHVLCTTTATYPGDFPLYIEVSGIKVTVTAIVGASSPQTFTVDPTTVTKNLHTGDSVAPWRSGVIAL